MSRHVREPNLAKGIRKWGKVGFQVYTDEEMFDTLRALAIEDRTSVSEVVRTFIEWGIEVREEEKTALSG